MEKKKEFCNDEIACAECVSGIDCPKIKVGEGIYQFAITLNGYGKTPEEAWNDACNGFALDPGGVDESNDIVSFEPECDV